VNARSPRLVRGAILAALMVVGVSIAWTYRRPGSSPKPSPSPSASPSLGMPQIEGAARTQNLVFTQVSGADSKFKLTAGEMVGKEEEELRLRAVDFEFDYTAKGEKHKGHIVADECVYTPTLQKAVFQGHVKLTTDDGAELRTEQLIYRGDKQLARSEMPVEFKRQTLSGAAKGFEYHGENGELEMNGDVLVRAEPQGKPPLEIRSQRALLVREEGTMRFTEDVRVNQAGDQLTTDRFELDFGDDNVVYRARAIEQVVLQTSSALTPGAAAAGTRHLKCRKLDLWFRPDGSLQEATAVDEAVLTLTAAPKEPPERRKLEAGVITFKFDAGGRLEGLQTLKETTFTATPLPPNKGPARTLTCARMTGEMDPATGQPTRIEFDKDVVFVEGPRKGTGQKAFFDGAKGELFLDQGPQLVDTEQGSDLTAQGILIGTRTGNVAANEQVRHLLKNTGRKQGSFLGHTDEPILITSRFLEYTSKTRVARYWEGALLRTGSDEIRAAEVRLQDQQQGTRRLEAEGSVISLLHPKPSTPDAKAPAAVEARAKKMTYEESRRALTYEGDVAIKQGDIATRSPQAWIVLTADGTRVESMTAGDTVEVVQGNRKARGSRGIYTPRDETMVLTGDRVVLQDPQQQVEGRSLTFHVGDDRILVDGREQVRTQTIIRAQQKEPPSP
jgi:lipopolysaccharide transport protein LptA/LPS export ABC transporter protein LptC